MKRILLVPTLPLILLCLTFWGGAILLLKQQRLKAIVAPTVTRGQTLETQVINPGTNGPMHKLMHTVMGSITVR